MSVFKCKMCGGDLELFEGVSVAVCEYCGTKQTVPKTEDEKKANLFNRANRLRFGNEFDRAAGIYESIIAEFPEEAEAYWGLVLCKYGIEYVDDPTTANKIPTCHRTSFESIFSDPNYLQSVKLADPTAKALYEKEAAEIDRLQQKILNIVNREKPFDVFICYKETDANGNRTTDSVLAQDIYDHLTEKGFNVFFARITLEDKLGQEYEPYIFAALNSAKVMLVVGTSYENFTAVWVKNEWNRFLALSKTKTEKVLIPVYKDIDAYDLPEEFKNLQAQDMAKIGFTQDLIRGIKKIAQNEEPKPTVVKETVVTAENTNIAPLLKRAFMFLEDGEWDRADDFCEQVLNIDPECAEAYLGKLMAEIRVRKQEELKDLTEPFDNSNNYQKAVRFADEKLKTALISYIEHINTRNENARLDGIYTRAKNAMSAANTESAYKEAAALFESVSEYQDSAALAQSCYEKAEEEKKKAEEEKKKCDELYKEYKAAVQNEKTGAVKKAEANKEIASLKIAYNNLNNLKNSWQGIEDELFSVNERLNSIKAEIVSLTNEKAKLGLFAGKRKKEIAERIAMLENNRESLIGDIASLQKKKLGYNTLSEVESKTNRITQQIEEQNKIIEELSSARSSQTIREELNAFGLGKKLLRIFDHLQNIKVGKYITFGAYEPDNKTSNGKEDVEWLVLEIKDGKALVISKYALDCQQYNTSYTDVTWETCSLRKWLNNDFINSAFSDNERKMIPTVTVTADPNHYYVTDPGNDTEDKVFLLSIDVVNKYFSSDSERVCYDSNGYSCDWWLRSPGRSQNYAAYVNYHGSVYDVTVDNCAFDVRPALWIDLNS